MTLDEVMKLEGFTLCEAVAERLGWQRVDPDTWRRPDGKRVDFLGAPFFATDWNAAMRVREWARGLYWKQRDSWIDYVARALSTRTGKHHTVAEAFLYAEPIDYARAALLVSP